MHNHKLFVVRKYVWANNAQEAIKRERRTPVEDVWIDEDFKKNAQSPRDAIGFNVSPDDE